LLAIDRTRSLRPRFIVRDDGGQRGTWAKERLFKETLAGDLDGEQYGFRRDGKKRLVLTQSDLVIATADPEKGRRWTVNAGDWSGELRPTTSMRAKMELYSGDALIGTVHKGKGMKGLVVAELPPTLPAPLQVFVALLAMTLWNRGGGDAGLANLASG
jgi:hypothetical protein